MQPGPPRQKRIERVTARNTEFFVELADGGGTQPISVDQALSFDGVRSTVEAIASELADVWERVKPSEAIVEFGLSVTAKSGRLTGLLVDADGGASLKVSLRWTAG